MRKAVLASICILLGCIVNVQCIKAGNTVAGAVLFALGLITVCTYGLDLYTGKIGYVRSNKNYIGMLKMLVVNLAAGYILGYAARDVVAIDIVKGITDAKLEQNIIKTIIASYFCGTVMFLAVDMYKKDNILGILFGIPAFILSGFEHCVANAIYFGMAGNIACLTYLAINVVGNTAGSIITEALLNKS